MRDVCWKELKHKVPLSLVVFGRQVCLSSSKKYFLGQNGKTVAFIHAIDKLIAFLSEELQNCY